MAGDTSFEMQKSPARNAADLEQVFPSEPPGELIHTRQVPWWNLWNSQANWEELATNEKGQILQTGKAFRRASVVALISIIVNVILLLSLFIWAISLKKETTMGSLIMGSWAVNETSSVIDAEGVYCFGRGVRYADSLGEGCECNQCHWGTDCSQLNETCTVDVSRYALI